MKLKPFELERYFAKYEFSAKYLLSSSDCDGISQKDLLDHADSELKKMWDTLRLGYTESLGNPLLREEISKLYQSIKSNQVLVITPEEGIYIVLNTLLEHGDNVICTFPGYQSLYEVAQGLGCTVTKWLPDEINGWRFDPDNLEKNIKPNTKLIIINFPHNPTGYLPTKEDFDRIIEIAKEHNLYVLSDEMYRFLEQHDSLRLPSASDVYENAISLFGMSKTFGMAGVRIGWLTTQNVDSYNKFATFKDYTTICSSAPSELLSIMALREKTTIIQNHKEKIAKNLLLLEDFFNKHKDVFSWVKPKAGTICFPKLEVSKSSYDFCEDVVKESGVMVLPSTVYSYDDKHIRIGFGRQNMPKALEVFENYLRNNY